MVGGEWKTGLLRKDLEPRLFPLMLLGTGKVESGSSIGKFKGNMHHCSGVSRRASAIFFCANMLQAFRPGTEDVDLEIHSIFLQRNAVPDPTQDDDLGKV